MRMAKLAAAAGITASLFFLWGCSNTAPQVKGERSEIKLKEKGKLGDTEIMVEEVQVIDSQGELKPEEGNRFLRVVVTMKNSGDGIINFSPVLFDIETPDGNRYDPILNTREDSMRSGQLIPGGAVRGSIVFEPPEKADGLKLIFMENIFKKDDVIAVDLENEGDGNENLAPDMKEEEGEKFGLGSWGKLKNMEIRVDRIERAPSLEDSINPRGGMEFVIIHVTLRNSSKETQKYDVGNFKMRNGKGQVLGVDGSTFALQGGLMKGQITSQNEKRGVLVFMEEEGDKNLVLYYAPDVLDEGKKIIFKIE